MMNYSEIAKPYYSKNQSHFHNFEHAKNVNSNAIKIAKTLGLEELIESIDFSTWFHDAGYHHKNKLSRKFATKEDYSIYIMNKISKENNISKEILELAIDGVEGTKINQDDFSTEIRKILRAADISNLGGNFEDMLKDSIKIYKEYGYLNKDLLIDSGLYPLPRELFREKQSEILFDILEKTKLNISEEYFLNNGFYDKFSKNISSLKEYNLPFTHKVQLSI